MSRERLSVSDEKQSVVPLLLKYLFIYPLYFSIAMLVVSIFGTWYMEWGYEEAKLRTLFLVSFGWLYSYAHNFNILRYIVKKSRQKNKS